MPTHTPLVVLLLTAWAVTVADGAACACDGLQQGSPPNDLVFSGKSDTICGSSSTTSTPFQQNGACLAACDAQYHSTPNQESKCKSQLWCQVKNCLDYAQNDCSVCVKCASGFELELNDNPSRRACRTLKLPVLTCPLAEAELPPKLTKVGVTYAITVTDNIAVAGEATCSPPSGSEFGVGTHTVTCSAFDVNGNEGFCTLTVSVSDVTPPEFLDCPEQPFSYQVNVSNPETYTQEASFTVPSAEDLIDGPAAVTCVLEGNAVQSGNITIGFGETIVSCSAADESLNSATCLVKYIVAEAGNPTLSCPTLVKDVLPLGSKEMQVSFSNNITAEFAGGPLQPVSCSPPSNSLFGTGVQSVNCEVRTADNLKFATCNFVVEVLDEEDPELFCPSDKQVDPPEGTSIAAVTFNNPALRDNDAIDLSTLSCTHESGDLFSLGLTTVVCTARDVSGNAGSCSFRVSVNDREAPVFTSCPSFADPLPVAETASTRPVNWTSQLAAVDNAPGVVSLSCSPVSGIRFAVDTHIITCAAVDASGNQASCVFSFSVVDTTLPAITCPNAITTSTDLGVSTTTVNFSFPTATDNLAVSRIECTRTPPAQFVLGRTAVTCFAFDTSNNQKTCEFEVNVLDNEDPVLTRCPKSVIQQVATRDDTAIPFPFSEVDNITATDNDNTRALLVERFINNAIVANYPALWPIGTSDCAYRVTDAAGRSTQCTWTFKVEPIGDFEPPVIHNCPNETIRITTDANKATAAYSFALNVTDNRPNIRQPEYVSVPEPSLKLGSNFPQGFTRLLIIVKDEAGNADTCEFDIIVTDNQAPELFCPVDFTVTMDPGATTTFVRWDDPIATDNVAVKLQNTTRLNAQFFEAGTYYTEFTATDLDDNTADCNWTLSVQSQLSAESSSNLAALGGLGGAAFAVILVLVLLAFLWHRHTTKKILALEEQSKFNENEEWVLARAQAIQQAMRNRGLVAAPTGELDDGNPLRKRMQAPPGDLKDLYNLDEYMPYEAIARELDRSQVELKSEIGAGEFGTVWDGIAHMGGNRGDVHVAVKMLKSDLEEHAIEFRREIAISGQFQHPNVVELVGFVTKTDPVLMCLEFLSLGNLKSYLQSDSVVNQLHRQEMLHMATDIAHGMHYIQTLGVLHRDLAARNVLVASDLSCKIADFGLAMQFEEGQEEVMIPLASQTKLPVRWTALEAMTEGRWTLKADVWSFGIVLWEIWTYAKLPYPSLTNQRVLASLKEGERLGRPDNCPMMVYAVMMDCWIVDTEERISLRRAYKRLVAAWGEQDEVDNYDNTGMDGPPSDDDEDEGDHFGFDGGNMPMYDMGGSNEGGGAPGKGILKTKASEVLDEQATYDMGAAGSEQANPPTLLDEPATYDMGAAAPEKGMSASAQHQLQDFAMYDMGVTAVGSTDIIEAEVDMEVKRLSQISSRPSQSSQTSYISVAVDDS